MRIIGIHVRNFLGYEELDLDLTDVNRLVIVGPNMAGKSTLLDAVTWALFDKARKKSPDKLIRDGADLAHVHITFEANGHLIDVTREKPRGKTGTLSLSVDHEMQTQHTTAQTFAAIEKWVGLSLDGMLAGPIMVQRESDALMQREPRARKDLLIGLLELHVYETLHERAKQCRDEFEAARTAAERRIEMLTPVLAATEDLPHRMADARTRLNAAMDEVGARTTGLTEAQVALAGASHDETRFGELMSRIARLFEGKRTTDASLTRAREAVGKSSEPTAQPAEPDARPETYDADITAAQERLSEARVAREQHIRAESRVAAADASLVRARRDAETVETVPCQTILHRPEDAEACLSCRFLVDAVGQRDAIPVIVTERDAAAASAVQIADAAASTAEWTAEVERMQSLRRQNEAAWSAYHEWAAREEGMIAARLAAQARVDDLELSLAGMTTDLAELQVLAEPLRAAEDRARLLRAKVEEEQASLIAARGRVVAAEDPVRELEAESVRRADAQADLSTEREAKAYATEQAATYRVLAHAFHRDGIPTSIIETAIPVIEDAANEVLGRLPGDMRISLRTQRETATGGMVERMEIVVITDGWERDYELLSTGGKFRVDLALRLGLGKVLTHRTGTKINTLWLDEPLADLDAESREAVIETLAAVAEDFDLTVVVSHHPEFNDAFEHVLQVSMDGGVSTAVLT